jgi:hypothetical protein
MYFFLRLGFAMLLRLTLSSWAQVILLPQPPSSWNYRCESLCPALAICLNKLLQIQRLQTIQIYYFMLLYVRLVVGLAGLPALGLTRLGSSCW